MPGFCARLLILIGIISVLNSCRGREFAKPMPPFTRATSESLIVFQSDDELDFRSPRIHFISPIDGQASELDRKRTAPVAQVMSAAYIVYAGLLIAGDGTHAALSTAQETTGNTSAHGDILVSPDGVRFFRRDLVRLTVRNLRDKAEYGPLGDLADCDWETSDSILCLSGKYQQRRQIVRLSADLKKRSVLFEIASKEKLENLVVAPDKKTVVFTANRDDRVTLYRLNLASGNARPEESFAGRYIFAIAVSADGVIAARIVKSRHEPDTLDPYDVWISEPFGPATKKGYLLNLPALDSPGFFSGKGFRGVDGFAFSPDGQRLAILMSRANDCRMADEGGNLACRQNIYIVDRGGPALRQLTEFHMTSARKLQWLKFLP